MSDTELTYVSSMDCAIVDIEVWHGSDWSDSIQLGYPTDDPAYPDGFAPKDMTGRTYELVVRPRAEQDPQILRVATDNGSIIHTNEPSGQMSFYVPRSVVDALPVGAWTYAMRESAIGAVTPIMRGAFLIHPTKY